MTVHIGQSTVNPVVAHRELFVVDTQLMQDRGVDVVAAHRVVPVGRSEAPLVAFAVGHPAADATTGEPIGEYEQLTVRHDGIDRRLTDVHGHVIQPILA